MKKIKLSKLIHRVSKSRKYVRVYSAGGNTYITAKVSKYSGLQTICQDYEPEDWELIVKDNYYYFVKYNRQNKIVVSCYNSKDILESYEDSNARIQEIIARYESVDIVALYSALYAKLQSKVNKPMIKVDDVKDIIESYNEILLYTLALKR